MEEPPQEGAEGTERSVAADGIPNLPPELSTKEQELRELIDAGASSPEELRDLAAKLKEQRSYERSVWQQEVRPALMQAKKKRLSLVDLRRDTVDEPSNSIALGLLLAVAMLVLVIIAANTSFVILLIAPIAVLVYAAVQGRHADDEPDSRPPDTDA